MSALLNLLSGLLRIRAAQAARRFGTASVLMLLAMLFLMIGITGLMGALWIALARLLDPVSAALIIGGGGCVIAAVFLLIAVSAMKSPRPALSSEIEMLLTNFKSQERGSGMLVQLVGIALLGFLRGSKGRK